MSRQNSNQIRYQHRTYEFWLGSPGESPVAPFVPYWSRLGSRPRPLNKERDKRLIKKLNKLLDHADAQKSSKEQYGSFSRKTGRDKHGRKRFKTVKDSKGKVWTFDLGSVVSSTYPDCTLLHFFIVGKRCSFVLEPKTMRDLILEQLRGASPKLRKEVRDDIAQLCRREKD